MTRDEERDLKEASMRAEFARKQKQVFWETPRNLVLIVAAATSIAGVLGFVLGQTSPSSRPIIIQMLQPAAAPAVRP